MNPSQNNNRMRVVLASGSPRRRELLSSLEIEFEVKVPAIDERPRQNEMPSSFALRMAFEKAQAVIGHYSAKESVCVIAADTIVVLGQKILGKPRDEAHAAIMLRELSGKPHQVITGLCVWIRHDGCDRLGGDAVRTAVVFRPLLESEIHHYVSTGEPMDKAGAYAIQGGAAGMIDHVDGSYSNVVGLPMEALTRLLRQEGFALPEKAGG